jgi:hypothetical protein
MQDVKRVCRRGIGKHREAEARRESKGFTADERAPLKIRFIKDQKPREHFVAAFWSAQTHDEPKLLIEPGFDTISTCYRLFLWLNNGTSLS